MSSLPDDERKRLLGELSEAEADALLHDWRFWARPSQLPSDWGWFVWVILAGRGWGKTRTGGEMVRVWVRDNEYVNLIGATADDARDIMVLGESGLLAICPDAERPRYVKSERRLDWPNGAKSLIFTADEPERLRGKQHGKLWGDEIGAWRYVEAWDQAKMGLRLGSNPQAVLTTTPRPTKIIKALMADKRNHVTRGSTYDNQANLPPGFFSDVVHRYEGTRLGRQELNAEILDDAPGALWQRGRVDELRVVKHPQLTRVVVAVDPEASSAEGAAETGIVVAGVGEDGHGYVLDDLSLQATPHRWAQAAVTGYHKHLANVIVAEANNGGEMVGYTIQTVDPNVPVTLVHASRGKATRAEPVSALYEQGRVHHVGSFPELEDQMCSWLPGDKSPDRMDALVWALTELGLAESGSIFAWGGEDSDDA
jgi:phage terminase large subunit-like protein